MTSMADTSTSQRRILRGAIAIASLGASLAVAGCSSTVAFDDPFADYLQRTALVSTTGGDAQAANTAIQTATPWPRYANNTNIPANGARMTAAIKRYESGAASASEGSTQTGTNPGANPGAGASNGASTGMATSPAAPSPGY
jgi:hypothetical protein